MESKRKYVASLHLCFVQQIKDFIASYLTRFWKTYLHTSEIIRIFCNCGSESQPKQMYFFNNSGNWIKVFQADSISYLKL